MKLLVLALFTALGSAAMAQSMSQPMSSPSNGLFASCTDSQGKPVGYYQIPTPDEGPAFSTLLKNGEPAIVYNVSMLAKYSTSVDTARFIFLHECGHCALGHIYANKMSHKKTNQQELDADCYAAKRGKSLGLNLTNVLKDVNILPRDPDHPAGPVRAKNIEACYNSVR
jgi:hypothetical protein